MDLQKNSADFRRWAMILHFSQFSGLVVPYAGFIVPILIWQLKKEEFPSLDAHGKMVTNWIISEFIYSVIAAVLCFVLIGFLMFPVIIGMSIIFPIIGGIRASEGKLWNYPLTINIL